MSIDVNITIKFDNGQTTKKVIEILQYAKMHMTVDDICAGIEKALDELEKGRG